MHLQKRMFQAEILSEKSTVWFTRQMRGKTSILQEMLPCHKFLKPRSLC